MTRILHHEIPAIETDSTFTGAGTAESPLSVATPTAVGNLTLTGSGNNRLILQPQGVGSNASNLRWRDSAGTNLVTMGHDSAGNGEASFYIFSNQGGKLILFDKTSAGVDQGGFISLGATSGGFQYDDATTQLSFYVNGATGKLSITPTEVNLMANAMRVQATALGFFGAAPVARPTVTGSRGATRLWLPCSLH